MNTSFHTAAGGRAPISGNHIDLDDADDVVFWTERFDVSMDELKDAVLHVGTDPAQVDRFLVARAG
jgi:hypothetical protein